MQKNLKTYCQTIDAFGYAHLPAVYAVDDIATIETHFDNYFMQCLKRGQVQSRDFRRYTCKLPLDEVYLPILNNPLIHQLLSQLLGEDYVLFNFNSHSSLPGSSEQIMHVDSTDSFNSQTYTNNQTNVAFLHIPMIDTQVEHGATHIWPATLFRQKNSHADSDIYQWVRENLPSSSSVLKRGDVMIKRDNCIHAGGANQSNVRRHMITLIFARKNHYLTYNSGMIPCGDYQSISQKLPYSIASHCRNIPNDAQQTFQTKSLPAPTFSGNDVKQRLYFQQYSVVEKAFEAAALTDVSSSGIFNLVQAALPLLTTAFGQKPFYLHSANLHNTTRDFDCDDTSFKQALSESTFNDQEKILTLHIALEDCQDVFSVYKGNKVLAQCVLKDRQSHPEQKQSFSLKQGDMLITTGATIYAKNQAARTLSIRFICDGHLPSCDDRLYISDHFYLSLPNSLSRLIHYEAIYITQEQFKQFQYNKRSHFIYIIGNYLGKLRVKNKTLGTLASAFGFVCLTPILLYFFLTKSHNNALNTLKTY